MAAVFTLAKSDASASYNLLGGTLRLVDGSWSTRTPESMVDWVHSTYGAQSTFKHFETIQETLDLVGQGTVAQLVAAVNSIEGLLETARRWHEDPLGGVQTWLTWQADTEAAKRSLVYGGTLSYPGGTTPGVSPMMEQGVLIVRLSLTRHPLWERTTPEPEVQAGAVTMSCFGSKHGFGIVGTVPARIAIWNFSGDMGPV